MSKRKNRRQAKKTYQQTEIKQPNYEKGSILADDEKREVEEELLEQTRSQTFQSYPTEEIFEEEIQNTKVNFIEGIFIFTTFIVLNYLKLFVVLPIFIFFDLFDQLENFAKKRYDLEISIKFLNEIILKYKTRKFRANYKKMILAILRKPTL